jgi:carbon monoxide dehydrogenase subunit G
MNASAVATTAIARTSTLPALLLRWHGGNDSQEGIRQIGRDMNEFEVTTIVNRPIEDVFAAVRDVAKAPLWTPGLQEVRRTSEGPIEVGATMIYVGTFLGRRFESPVTCTALIENKQLATTTTGGPYFLEVDQRLEPDGAGTKLTTRCRGESRGFFKLAEPLVVHLTQRQFDTGGGNLKALLEDQVL